MTPSHWTMTKYRIWTLLFGITLLAVACSDSDDPIESSEDVDIRPVDHSDAGPMPNGDDDSDVGPQLDGGPENDASEAPDTGTADTGTPNTGSPDTDTGSPNTDTGTPDTGSPDTDTGTPDTGTPDPDTGTPDTGAPDTDEEPDTSLPPLAGDTCEDAIDVTEGGFWEGESTLDMTNAYDPSMDAEHNCVGTNFSDKDRVYVVSPDEDTTYKVRVEPISSNFDPMIYVRTDCDADACIAGTQLISLTFDAPGGQDSFIIVDGFIGTSGDFDLKVTIE